MKNIAIITGATGGLGKSFTKHLIDEVDEVWAVGRNLDKNRIIANRNKWT